ncbi:MAG: hypothetical protein QOG21_1372 [Actinomycetota bacterium]|nr:hypothetical protein [Actinomycetota bacterium]
MTTGAIAALISVLALGMVEALNRFYPARSTWLRLRSRNGRRAVRAMRERFEQSAQLRTPRLAALALAGLVVIWIATAGLLDKRWYEVVLDVMPYVFIAAALLRVPAALRSIAARMRRFELDMGEDPDARPGDDGGPTAIAL